jgi:hypothetical protein
LAQVGGVSSTRLAARWDVRMNLHADMRIQKLTVGAEQAPLLVIDNFVANADELVDYAASETFTALGRYYPGIRCTAPMAYQRLLLTTLAPVLLECLGVPKGALRFSMCHYSLITTPAGELAPLQRIPHVDSLSKLGLASIHYLFKADLGGTAFYRHRSTGFESIDAGRNDTYARALQAECVGANTPGLEYINGDTALFEQIGRQDGVFNRILFYRRNVLHSGCIGKAFVPDANPRTGRLSINSFIDVTPA